MKERRSDGVKSCHHCHHYNFKKFVSKLKREGNTLELPSPFGRVRAHDFFFFYLQRSFFVCSVRFLFAAFRLFAVGIFYLQRSFLFAAYFFLFAAYFFICSVHFLFAAYFFYLQAYFFYLQRSFFVCSVSFLFAAFLFCLQRFFFVCSVSLVGHRRNAVLPCSPNQRFFSILDSIKNYPSSPQTFSEPFPVSDET